MIFLGLAPQIVGRLNRLPIVITREYYVWNYSHSQRTKGAASSLSWVSLFKVFGGKGCLPFEVSLLFAQLAFALWAHHEFRGKLQMQQICRGKLFEEDAGPPLNAR